jgi:hypothetical protein
VGDAVGPAVGDDAGVGAAVGAVVAVGAAAVDVGDGDAPAWLQATTRTVIAQVAMAARVGRRRVIID